MNKQNLFSPEERYKIATEAKLRILNMLTDYAHLFSKEIRDGMIENYKGFYSIARDAEEEMLDK